MAYVETKELPFEQNMAYLAGEAPMPTSNIQLTSGPTLSQETGPSEVTAAPTQQGAEQTAPSPATSSYETGTGGIQERLLKPLQTGLPKEQENIKGLREAFNQQAGASRTWENEGKSIFDQAIESGDTLPAKDLLGATYTGPMALDDSFSKSDYEIGNLYGRASALQSPAGIMGYVQTVDPSKTSGKARFEAGSLAKDEGFRAQAKDLYGQAQAAKDYAAQQQKEATEFAKQRQTEESEIAKLAQEYGRKQVGDIYSGIDKRIEETGFDEKSKAVQEAYAAMAQKGTLPTDVELPGLKDVYSSDIVKGMSKAEDTFDKIMNLTFYKDIKDVPPLELMVTNHGSHYYKVPDAWANSKQGKKMMADPRWAEQFDMAIRRQQKLEKFFDPYSQYREYLVRDGEWQPEGKYSKYMPLYYTGGKSFELSNPASYTSLNPGVAPTRGNISTEAEREKLNRLLDALNLSGAIEGEATPYAAPELSFNAKKYLSDEAARLKQWDENPTKAGEQYFGEVHDARKAYRDAEGSGLFGTLKDIAVFKYPEAAQHIQNWDIHDWLENSLEGAYWAQAEGERRAQARAEELVEKMGLKPADSKPQTNYKTNRDILEQLRLLEQSGLLR